MTLEYVFLRFPGAMGFVAWPAAPVVALSNRARLKSIEEALKGRPYA
jgi:hypothetical protein